jgi:hypothetical protein
MKYVTVIVTECSCTENGTLNPLFDCGLCCGTGTVRHEIEGKPLSLDYREEKEG